MSSKFDDLKSKTQTKYKIEPYDDQAKTYTNDPLPINVPSVFSFIGSRGSGKSTVILSLSRNTYNGVFHRIIFFNPTFFRDEKYQQLLEIPNIIKKKPKEKEEIPKTKPKNHPYLIEPKEVFTGKIPITDVYTSDIPENLMKIVKQKIELNNKNERWLIVLDDVASSGLLRNNGFLDILLNGRHLNITLWMGSQFYTALNPSVRLNTMTWFIFNFSNVKEVKRFYIENSCKLSEEDWFKIYKTATKDPYSFLTINYHNLHDKCRVFTSSLKNFIYIKDNGL